MVYCPVCKKPVLTSKNTQIIDLDRGKIITNCVFCNTELKQIDYDYKENK